MKQSWRRTVEVETGEEIVSRDGRFNDDNLDVEPVGTFNEDIEEVISIENIGSKYEDHG